MRPLLNKRPPRTMALRFGALVACAILHSSPASADSLKDVLKSETMKRLEISGNGSSQREAITDGDPTSNFSSIWKTRSAPEILLSWLDISASGYKSSNPIAAIENDHASAQVSLVASHGEKAHLIVQIPKPVFSTMAEFNQLGSFRRFRPPQLQIKSSESIEINGTRADIYQSQDGDCSVVIGLERFGILNISRRDCKDPSALVKIAKALNIKRLNEKLSS